MNSVFIARRLDGFLFEAIDVLSTWI